jgi:hypothetical protein
VQLADRVDGKQPADRVDGKRRLIELMKDGG